MPGADAPQATTDAGGAAGPGEQGDKRFSLSPSRASDFQSCPLRYRLRHVDRLPEPPGPEAYRGTLVHAVLERLFDLPAADRTLRRALELVPAEWQRLIEEADGGLVELLLGPEGNWERQLAGEPLEPAPPEVLERFLQQAEQRLAVYFEMEDPTSLEPAERELLVRAEVAGGLQLRGYVDRLDRAPDGRTRVVDYKTGRSPSEFFEQQAMFQLRCYALALSRDDEGVTPTVLQLLYLGDGQTLRYRPDEADLRATERKLAALWQAILRAYERNDWRPRKSKLCDYCSFKAYCPEWGGTLPEASGGGAATVEA